jgi:hypothetical protein
VNNDDCFEWKVDVEDAFRGAEWIWTSVKRRNQFVLFAQNIELLKAGQLNITVTASHTYELYINGEYVMRGPVHGDPKWCQFDRYVYDPGDERNLQIVFVVHYSADIYLHYVLPSQAGLRAIITSDGIETKTDESWFCKELEMWQEDVGKRGWALDYFEDYDARQEPEGWQSKSFDKAEMAGWNCAECVPMASELWGGYQNRIVPYLTENFIESHLYKAFRVSGNPVVRVEDISKQSDEEPIIEITPDQIFDVKSVNLMMTKANAFLFDLGRECIGSYEFEVEAPSGIVIEVSGAELLRNGRPWIYRKNTSYSLRYITRQGSQKFKSFAWSGLRYLYIVIRGNTDNIHITKIGCRQRSVPLNLSRNYKGSDETLKAIFDLCRDTLKISVQEHLIDCPTREQTQYWGDGVFIAQSLWKGFGENAYLKWYLECFLHVPFRSDGQISCTYPGSHPRALVDYSLISLLGQKFYFENTGAYYKPKETLLKAQMLKKWYDKHCNNNRLIEFDHQGNMAKPDGAIIFIDHPGLGWHNFPHPGIDRAGLNCAINMFYYGFISILSNIAQYVGDKVLAYDLKNEADTLKSKLLQIFYDGKLFHDSSDGEKLSLGRSWQTNTLSVYFDIIEPMHHRAIMDALLKEYDNLCRCSPYFYFFMLPALSKAGMHREACELIKKEWRLMLNHGATATWEGFQGDELDSLCHPWSTAPFLFLLME